MKQPLIIVTGPTACGKTKVSIELAKRINGEIISADSMQVYKYMDIGTAKATKQELCEIKHYLIDELYPDQQYSVAIFQEKAKKYIDIIAKKNKIPILVGGTGFYINALVYNNNFVNTKTDENYRNKLQLISEEKGTLFLHNILKKVDPNASELIHSNNIKRIIRALEFYKLTGRRISEHNEEEKKREYFYNTYFNILNLDRSVLYNKINNRVDLMMQNGLVEEVIKLLEMGYKEHLTSMQGIGYKQIIMYLKNEITLKQSIELLKRDTRRYAKRQLTWFNNQTDGNRINFNDDFSIDDIVSNIIDYYKK